MNENNQENINQYKASGNLNTIISNPNANINDTMNVNIQNIPMNNNMQSTIDNNKTNNLAENNQINNPQINVSGEQTQQTENVTKNYVSNNGNQNKKKTVILNVGPELKTALLIIIILLVFILILPIINDIVRDIF